MFRYYTHITNIKKIKNQQIVNKLPSNLIRNNEKTTNQVIVTPQFFNIIINISHSSTNRIGHYTET